MSQNTDFVHKYRVAVSDLIRALDNLRSARLQYTAEDMGNTLTDNDCYEQDWAITKEDFVSGVAAIDTIEALFQNAKTPVYRIAR